MEPYDRLGIYGQGVTGLISGYPGQYQSMSQPNPTALQTALGTGVLVVSMGIYGQQLEALGNSKLQHQGMRYQYREIGYSMSRTLNRPMFRRGGQATGGITTGLGRQGYAKAGSVTPMDTIRSQMEMLEQLAPQSRTGLNDFLINFGA